MNKKVIGITALISLGVFIVFGTIAAVLIGLFFRGNIDSDSIFSFGSMGSKEFNLDFDESYNLDGIETIKVSVVTSEVNLYNSAETVDVVFSGNGRAVNSGVKLIVEETDTMLYIYVKYPQFGNVWFMESHLSLGIPESFGGELIINGVSSAVNATSLNNELYRLSLDTVSGNVTASVKSIYDLKVDTTSGKIIVDTVVNNSLDFDSVSGNLRLEEIAEGASKVKANSTSGRIEIEYAYPCPTDIDTVSSDVELDFIQDGDIDLDFDSVSGDVDGSYSTNSSGIKVNVDTTSGDLTIR